MRRISHFHAHAVVNADPVNRYTPCGVMSGARRSGPQGISTIRPGAWQIKTEIHYYSATCSSVPGVQSRKGLLRSRKRHRRTSGVLSGSDLCRLRLGRPPTPVTASTSIDRRRNQHGPRRSGVNCSKVAVEKLEGVGLHLKAELVGAGVTVEGQIVFRAGPLCQIHFGQSYLRRCSCFGQRPGVVAKYNGCYSHNSQGNSTPQRCCFGTELCLDLSVKAQLLSERACRSPSRA